MNIKIDTQEVEEILEYITNNSLEKLLQEANDLRKKYKGNKFDSCSIMNARSGRCSEDCAWCSQSIFYKTKIDIYPLVSTKEALDCAKHNASQGIRRFSLVTSGKGLKDAQIDEAYDIYKTIDKNVDINLCASMGLLDLEQMQKLYDAGVRRYHCNIETAPSFFSKLCTTHTIDDKIQTLENAQKVGMTVCSGGIIGMGEGMRERIEMAILLRELKVDSIPINILNPIKGTPLENQPPLSKDEVLRSIAMFRIVNPKIDIRLAGGREALGEDLERALCGGVNSAIMGDMLTTIGSKIEQDKEMLKRLNLEM